MYNTYKYLVYKIIEFFVHFRILDTFTSVSHLCIFLGSNLLVTHLSASAAAPVGVPVHLGFIMTKTATSKLNYFCIITCNKEVLFYLVFVCLSVCLFATLH